MQRGVWPALNTLSIHVTFTAIVPEAYPGETKVCKNVLKWRTFELTGWITGKRLKIDGYMLQCVWQALNPLFIHVTFTAIVPGTYYPGEAKMCLRLSWRSQIPPAAKRLKATTYRRDSSEVAKLWLRLVFMKLTRDLFAIANKFLLKIDIDLWANMRTIGAARAALVKFIIIFFCSVWKSFCHLCKYL